MKAVVTERLSDGMNKLFGKGFSDKLTNQVVDKLAKSPAGKIVLRFLLNANNEGLENVIDDVLDPLLQRSIRENNTAAHRNISPMWM